MTAYLSDVRVELHAGDIVQTSREVQKLRFSLVHIDVDLYEPMLHCLEFFGERMVPGGLIVVDDFGAPKCPGVRRAAEDYLATSPPVQVWNSYTEQLLLISNPTAGAGNRLVPWGRKRRASS